MIRNGRAFFPKMLIIIVIFVLLGFTRYPNIFPEAKVKIVDLFLFRQLFDGKLECSTLDRIGKGETPRYSHSLMRVQANCALDKVILSPASQAPLREALFRWQQGFHAFNQNKLDEAVAAWSKSSLVVEKLKGILIADGNNLESKGLAEEAEKYYRAVVLLDPQPWRYEYLGDYYLRRTRQVMATEALRQGQLISGLADWYYLEGRINEINQDWLEAVDSYLKSIGNGGENGNILFRLAQLYGLRLKDKTNSIVYCQRAIIVEPSNYACYEYLGELYKSQGEIDKAIKYYQDGIQQVGGTHAVGYKSMFYSRIGDIYIALGEDNKAEASYDRAVSLSPYNGEAQSGLARLMVKRGDIESAINLMNLAIQGNQGKGFSVPVEWYLELGSYYERAGDKQKAISFYQQVLNVDPENTQAQERMVNLENDQ